MRLPSGLGASLPLSPVLLLRLVPRDPHRAVRSLDLTSEGVRESVEMLEDSGKVRRSIRPPAPKPSRGNYHAKSEAIGCGQLCCGIRFYG